MIKDKNIKFYIANDHAGINIKNVVMDYLASQNCYEIINLGTDSSDCVDYTDYAHLLAQKVSEDSKCFGILICGTGIGMSITANKHKGIRAALCHDVYTAKMARAHNDANVLCLGERVLGSGVVKSIIEAWIDEPFLEGKHRQRVDKLECN